MKELYENYSIDQKRGFYGVYFQGRFLKATNSVDEAKIFIDQRNAERCSQLLSAELEASRNLY